MEEQQICFLIDDDLDDQEVFAMVLNEVNPSMQCFFAKDGIEALDKLNEPHRFIPHYIFIDLNMPRMDGKQCLVEIKKIHHLNNIPLIVYSTSSDEKYELELKKLGASAYIVKPTRIATLKQTLRDLFENK